MPDKKETPVDHRKRDWNAYRPSEKAGGVRIIRCMGKKKLMHDTYYRIRYLCCGEKDIMNHSQIRKRIGKDIKHCMPCGRIETRRKLLSKEIDASYVPMRFPPPGWDVPPLAKQMPPGWAPYGGSAICYVPPAWAQLITAASASMALPMELI